MASNDDIVMNSEINVLFLWVDVGPETFFNFAGNNISFQTHIAVKKKQILHGNEMNIKLYPLVPEK